MKELRRKEKKYELQVGVTTGYDHTVAKEKLEKYQQEIRQYHRNTVYEEIYAKDAAAADLNERMERGSREVFEDRMREERAEKEKREKQAQERRLKEDEERRWKIESENRRAEQRKKAASIGVEWNGGRYIGNIEDYEYIKPTGQGKFIDKDGNSWEGEWRSGTPYTGHGTYVYITKHKTTIDIEIYSGNMVEKEFHGQGEFTDKDGNTWSGEWRNGTPYTGKGVLQWDRKKHTYSGSIKKGKFHGQGKLSYDNDSEYYSRGPIGQAIWEGEWREGRPYEGRGEYISNVTYNEKKFQDMMPFIRREKNHPNCDVCNKYNAYFVWKGEWKNGRSENCEIITPLGNVYKGGVNENLHYDGEGELTYKDGKIEEGIWQDGVYIGIHKELRFNRTQGVYEGNSKGNLPENKGKITYSNGKTWEGEWKDGKPYTGKGTYTDPVTKERYTGRIVKGQYQGKGKLTYPNGNAWEGEWKDGKPYTGEGNVATKLVYFPNSLDEKSTISGKLVEGKLCGEVTVTYQDGKTLSCLMDNGRISKATGVFKTTLSYGMKTECNGEFGKYGHPINATGAIYNMGQRYEGRWVNSICNAGIVKCQNVTYEIGATYTGQLHGLNFHGNGIMTYTNGKSWRGEWRNDQRYNGVGYELRGHHKTKGEWHNGHHSNQILFTTREKIRNAYRSHDCIVM